MREEIERCLDHDGTVRDWASPELGRIRSKMRTLANRLKERLENLIHSPAMQKVLQEPIITVRSGRYVVPVKSEFRSKFQGIVHDQSRKRGHLVHGAGLCVELNNELSIAAQEEQAEVERILRRLSSAVGEQAQVFWTTSRW